MDEMQVQALNQAVCDTSFPNDYLTEQADDKQRHQLVKPLFYQAQCEVNDLKITAFQGHKRF